MMVREATIGDADALAALCALVQELHVSRRPDVFVPVARSTLAGWFRARLSEDGTRSWLAEVDEMPAGYAYAVFGERAANPFTRHLRWLEVVQLGVHPDHRRTGIARSLIGAAVAAARAEGVGDVRIRTWAFNEEAQAVFVRLGFRPRAIEYDVAPQGRHSPARESAGPPDEA